MNPTTYALPTGNAEQTHVLRAFITLMNAENQTIEAREALDVLSAAARDGKILDAVKSIARG